MSTYNFKKNLAQSSLASGYTAGNTTITVQTGDGSLFDAAEFDVAVGNPPQFFLHVTAVAGDTFTVDNTGADGSTAVSVTAGTPITEVVIKSSLEALIAQINQRGTRASLPSTTGQVKGYTYRCTDGPYEFIFDGTVWVPRVFGYDVTEPVLGNFTQVNTTQTTFTTTQGGIIMQVTQTGGDNLQVLQQNLPATPYYVDAAFTIDTRNQSSIGIGVGDGTKFSLITFGMESAALNWVKRVQLNSTTSFNNNSSAQTNAIVGPLVWLRVYDDGTNLKYYLSANGTTWTMILSEARTGFLTPSKGVFAVNPINSAPPVNVHLVHFSIHS